MGKLLRELQAWAGRSPFPRVEFLQRNSTKAQRWKVWVGVGMGAWSGQESRGDRERHAQTGGPVGSRLPEDFESNFLGSVTRLPNSVDQLSPQTSSKLNIWGRELQTRHANSPILRVSLGFFHQGPSPYRRGGRTPETGSVPAGLFPRFLRQP